MIQKFRWKFIFLSIISLLLILLLSTGSIIGVSFFRDYREANRVMDTLVKNEGILKPEDSLTIDGHGQSDLINGRRNPESVFQYRYFTISQNPNSRLTIINQPAQFNLDKAEINKKISRINLQKQSRGIVNFDHNQYSFRKIKNSFGKTTFIFLNISLIYQHSWVLLRIAVFFGILALLIFAIILILLSGKAIEPIAQTYKKQRRFITNAGHELKTPLAIISANTEMQEMLGSENEWTKSTKEQVDRLTQLINQLIALARVSEDVKLTLTRVNLSETVKSVSDSFSSIMKKKQLTFTTHLQDDVYVWAEEKTLHELVNIFIDNAQKYCDPNGKIIVSLNKNKLRSTATLTFSNSYKNGKNVDYSNFFDRFYREDKSHNSKQSGFGIGLSMAHDLVQTYKGKIKVHYHEGMISFIINLRLAKRS